MLIGLGAFEAGCLLQQVVEENLETFSIERLNALVVQSLAECGFRYRDEEGANDLEPCAL